MLIAVVGDLDPTDQFHDENGTAGTSHIGIEDVRAIGVVHQRERLTLGLEASNDLTAVQSQFDDLEGDAPFDRLPFLRHPRFTENPSICKVIV